MIRPWDLYQASETLISGGIIAYPTEAVFGLGCLPVFQPSVLKLLKLKRRSANKGLIIIAATVEQLCPYVVFNHHVQKDLVLDSWPGPTTWLLPARPEIPALLTGGSKQIAVRVSAHPVVQAICQRVGPVISTSANPARLPPARSLHTIRTYFHDSLDYVVPASIDTSSMPSEIRSGLNGEITRPAI